jgi:hypothetical protein
MGDVATSSDGTIRDSWDTWSDAATRPAGHRAAGQFFLFFQKMFIKC